MAVPQYSSHAVHVFRGRACGQRGGGVRGKHPHAMPPLCRSPVQVGLSAVSQPAQQGVHPALGAGVLGDTQLVEDLHCVGAGHAIHPAQVHVSTTCNQHTFQSPGPGTRVHRLQYHTFQSPGPGTRVHHLQSSHISVTWPRYTCPPPAILTYFSHPAQVHVSTTCNQHTFQSPSPGTHVHHLQSAHISVTRPRYTCPPPAILTHFSHTLFFFHL